MEKNIVSFSDCGQYFVHYGLDGKLKIWDTFSASLKQEYAPNLHLKSPCTCLTWMTFSSQTCSPNPKRKKKLRTEESKVIVLGTHEGSLALYSLSEGSIVSTLRDENSVTVVRDVSWSKEAGIFSVDGSHVTHWDLEFNSVERKWKCKGNTTRIAVSPRGDLCVTGSFNISLWDVKTEKCLRTFVGHSSEMCNLTFVNDNYFLSCGSNDRHISTWAAHGEDDAAIARFSVGETISGEISLQIENKTTLIMVVTTFSGSLLYYSQQLNGKVSKVIKPIQRVELINNIGEDEISSPTALPIICAQLKNSNTVSVAYGYSPLFGFETFNVSLECEKQIVSITKPMASRAKLIPANNLQKEGGLITDAVEYTNKVSAGASVKRKLGNSQEVSMEERLGNLCIDLKDYEGVTQTASQNPHNLSHLLIQGLESRDKNILDSVLLRRDPKVIHETVTRLPVHALTPLVKEIKRMMQGRTLLTMIGTEWMKVILREHASQLLADPTIQEYLNSVQSLIESRVSLIGPLGALAGRLDHIMQQLDADSQGLRNTADSIEPVILYREIDSSDEDGSLADGDYESEDKWEELSDQQLDSDPSS